MDMNMKEYVNWKMSHDVKYGENKGYPLVLEDCRKNKELKDFKIYGNSVQEDTPTRDNPIEVESVGELTMKNILDMSKHTVSNGYYYDNGGSAFDTNNNMLKISPIAVEPSTTYTISSNVPVYTIWLFKGEGGTSISRIDVHKKIKTFTTTKDCTQIRVSLDLRKMVTNGVQAMSLFQWAMLEKGFGDGIYEPYNKYKYKIPVKVRGKNIYKYNVGGLTNGSIIEQLDNGAVVKGNIPSNTSDFTNSYDSGWFRPGNPSQSSSAICPIVHKGDVVTISADITLLELRKEDKYTPNIYLYSYDINDGFISSILEAVEVNKTTRIKKTFTITSRYDNHMMYPIFPINGNIVKIENIQIEYGNTATEFESYIEPQTFNLYLDEPLRKDRYYADYIDFENKKIIRKNKAITKFGNNKFTQYGNWVVQNVNLSPIGVGTTIDAYALMCSYDSNAKFFNVQGTQVGFNLDVNGIDYKSETAMEEWTQLYDSWVESGKFLLQYALKNPIEEPVYLPELPKTQAKTMIYEVIDTTIEPSNMYGKYVKKY